MDEIDRTIDWIRCHRSDVESQSTSDLEQPIVDVNKR